MPKIKGIKQKKMWAWFSPDGNIQVRTIHEIKKESRKYLPREGSDLTWENYAAEGYIESKILVDIKLLD